MRRRASRLIPITVSPLKPKIRQLMLTSQRLICVKQRDRGVLSIKCELAFRPANVNVNGKEKEKDSRTYIIGVEPKTDREFVVLTVRFLSLSLSPFPSLASSSISNSSSCYKRPASPKHTQPPTPHSLPPGSTKLPQLSNRTSNSQHGHERNIHYQHHTHTHTNARAIIYYMLIIYLSIHYTIFGWFYGLPTSPPLSRPHRRE